MIAVHLENGRVEIREQAAPHRPPRFALLRLLAGGICNTDLELQRGYYEFSGTPGHEFVGQVVEADSERWIGRRVVGEINLACGKCEWCQLGMRRHCPVRTVLGILKHPGAFSEFLTLPEANLHEVPAGIPTEYAVFIEPLAAACEILDQVTIPTGERVAVLGDGKLGLLVGQVLQAHGARVTQYGRHDANLRLAELAGASTSRNPPPRQSYDFVVDATGSTEGLKHALHTVRPRGTIIMKSTVNGEVALDAAAVIVNEVALVGSRCGRFEPALALLSEGKVRVDQMIVDRMPLSEAPKAFELAAKRGVLKVLLEN